MKVFVDEIGKTVGEAGIGGYRSLFVLQAEQPL
jgi:hypothetical protein